MEFCYIGKPFLIRGLRVELTVKYIFGNILRSFCLAGTPLVRIFYRRLYIELTADPKDSFVIGFYAMITLQIIPDPPIPFVRGSFMDLFYFICYTLVFPLTSRYFPIDPFIIRCMGNTSKLAQQPDGMTVLFVFLFYCTVYGRAGAGLVPPPLYFFEFF